MATHKPELWSLEICQNSDTLNNDLKLWKFNSHDFNIENEKI